MKIFKEIMSDNGIMSETGTVQKKTTTRRRVKKTAGSTTKSAAAKTTKTKKTRNVKKTTPAPEPEPVVEETQPETVAVESAEEEGPSELDMKLHAVTHALSDASALVETALEVLHGAGFTQKELKAVGKEHKSLNKVLQKLQDQLFQSSLKKTDELQRLLNKKTRRNKGKSNPNSGIQKQHPCHARLAEFMNVDEGHPVSRVEALQAISKYVSENDLQVPEKKRTFYLKGDLVELFPDWEEQAMGYTQIMGAIKPFFPPAASKAKSK